MSSESNKKAIVVLFVALIILVIGFIVSGVLALTHNRALSEDQLANIIETNVLADGISIEDVDVSGMDEEQIRAALSSVIDSWYIDKDIMFTIDKNPFLYNIKEIGIEPDVDATIQAAFLYSENGTLPEHINYETTVDGINFEFKTNATLEKVMAFFQTEEIAEAINVSPDDAGVIFRPSALDESQRFSYELPLPGLEVDVDAFAPMVLDAIKTNSYSVMDAPYKEVNSFTSIDDMKYKTQLIGTYTSDIIRKLQITERTANIVQMCSVINQNGSILQPGETLSLNATSGVRTVDNGFYEAPALESGLHVTEVGGGVCQVASTVYIAALAAELDITEHTFHSLPSDYIPAGLDATISINPDLKIVNNKTSPIYISVVTDEAANTVTCNIYGEPAQHGYTTELVSKVVKTTLPSPSTYHYAEVSPGGYKIDPGEIYEYSEPVNGIRAKVYRLYKDADGKVVKSEYLYYAIYQAFAGEYYVNPNAE